ncbi:MAG: C25 family cysteine peptidase, partial [bacterium]|nr:C25 family cysteine peptidase [bacterium]
MKKVFFMMAFLFIFTGIIFAGVLTKEINFKDSDLLFQKRGDYDVIKIKGGNFERVPGKPLIPYKTVFISVPDGFKPESVKVINSSFTYLPQVYALFPSQKQVPIMTGEKGDTPEFIKMEEIYKNSIAAYPDKMVESTNPGYLAGHCIYGINVYPISYLPKTGQVKFYHSIQVEVTYSLDGKKTRPINHRNSRTELQFQSVLKTLVINPQEVEFNSMGLIKESSIQKGEIPDNTKPFLSPGEVDYVIITDPAYETNFQPLADWKTKKGIPTQIVTTDWLYANYTGTDNAEKIRNFIIDAYTNWGTQWILLGGDTDIIPERPAYAMTCGAGYYADEDDIPCDLYFSDLDGDWNANANTVYGELDDNIDMYPDVYVGRAPVDSASEVQAFVNKVLNYEKNPELDYQLRVSFVGAYLDSYPTDGGIAKDTIDTESFPSRFDPISKFYENNGTLSYTNVMNALTAGQNLFNHNDHCNEYVMGLGPDELSLTDMDNLTNSNRFTVLYSIGCWAAALDRDAIAEHFVVNPNGGGIFVGNSRYGWYSPLNPGNGTSDLFDREFWKSVFTE